MELHRIYTGALFEFALDDIDLYSALGHFSFIDNLVEIRKGWLSFQLRSPDPLIQEDIDKSPPYKYPFLIRLSSNKRRMLVVSIHESVVSNLALQADWRDIIRSAKIRIPDLVIHLTHKPDIYCLSIVYARIDGYGRALRTISLYGSDLAEAKLFHDILPKMVPFRIQLRDIITGEDILQLGSKGEVSFMYNGEDTLIKIDKSLIFLTMHGFLIWDE